MYHVSGGHSFVSSTKAAVSPRYGPGFQNGLLGNAFGDSVRKVKLQPFPSLLSGIDRIGQMDYIYPDKPFQNTINVLAASILNEHLLSSDIETTLLASESRLRQTVFDRGWWNMVPEKTAVPTVLARKRNHYLGDFDDDDMNSANKGTQITFYCSSQRKMENENKNAEKKPRLGRKEALYIMINAIGS
ncbi:hypothetical protein AVEN_33337-1 [Araneus ventricosus]|uniref:Uncharacterized protein n=1 Tax=Araneus ventricosus TaxID=182803 RepID=A0A4Y2S1T8_ARAVE|nr:hypothetical protein AVEN_33337-1 [Araneus ventricosus]